MAIYTHLENHDNFQLALCFFILIIILAVFTFCIIMTEIIIYDTRKVDPHTLNVISKLERLANRKLVPNYGRRHLKNCSQRKWKQLSKRQTAIKLKRNTENERIKIQTGTTVEQLINLLFEAMLTELKDRSDMKNKLCIPSTDGSTSEINAVAEKTLEDLFLRQNTLAILIKTLSNFPPEILERLVSLDISSSITYEDILNRLKKLQDEVVAQQKIAGMKANDHDKVNKKPMRKIGETEGIILESLIKEIKMTEDTMQIVDPEEGKIELPWISAEEINYNSPIIKTKLTDVEPSVKSSDVESANVEEPFYVKQEVTQPTDTEDSVTVVKVCHVGLFDVEKSSVRSSDAELIHVKPFDVKHEVAEPTEIENFVTAVKVCQVGISDVEESGVSSFDMKPSHAPQIIIESINSKLSVVGSAEVTFSEELEIKTAFEDSVKTLELTINNKEKLTMMDE